ncbi:hypothetical protein ONE63_001108 [Megalurothrips usitatus]|uniref:Uncharacterized protein n=1 Tax=Megalurothrips usitatus TaxID=439358 RepID=A0AAV7XEV9_9NEOP|nr:hypothetical protein ONE63_001108 [Megalurothrips usitatus]
MCVRAISRGRLLVVQGSGLDHIWVRLGLGRVRLVTCQPPAGQEGTGSAVTPESLISVRFECRRLADGRCNYPRAWRAGSGRLCLDNISGEGLNLKNISSAEANLTTRALIRVRSGIALPGIARKIHLAHRAAHLSDKAQYNVVGRIVVPEHF